MSRAARPRSSPSPRALHVGGVRRRRLVDRVARAPPVPSPQRVTALDHEVGDDPVKPRCRRRGPARRGRRTSSRSSALSACRARSRSCRSSSRPSRSQARPRSAPARALEADAPSAPAPRPRRTRPRSPRSPSSRRRRHRPAGERASEQSGEQGDRQVAGVSHGRGG